MSNREQQIKFILKYAPHTIIGKIKGGITRERLEKLSKANLSTLYRKARNIVQTEIFEKGIKIENPPEKKLTKIQKGVKEGKTAFGLKDMTGRERLEFKLLMKIKKDKFLGMDLNSMSDLDIKNLLRNENKGDKYEYMSHAEKNVKIGKKLREKVGADLAGLVAEFAGNEYNFTGKKRKENILQTLELTGKEIKNDFPDWVNYNGYSVNGDKNYTIEFLKPLSKQENRDYTNKRIRIKDNETGEYLTHGGGEKRIMDFTHANFSKFVYTLDDYKNKIKNIEDNKDMTKQKKPRGPPPPARFGKKGPPKGPPPPSSYNPYGMRDEERREKPKKTQSLSAIDLPEKMGDVKRSESMPVMSSRIEDTLDRFRMAIQENEEDDFAPDWVEEGEEEKTWVPQEGVVEVEEQPNSSLALMIPPPMDREETIPMKTPELPRNQIVKRARKQRKRDILSWALTDNGRKLWESRYGNMKQTSWTNDMVKNFVLELNNNEIEMAFKEEYGGIKNIKEALEITEAQRKVQPPLGRLVASKTEQINIGVEKKEKQLGVSGTTHINIEKEEAELGVSDIKQINIQPSFGVNKKVAQKTIGTQLGLREVGLSEAQVRGVERMGDLRELVEVGQSDINHNLIRNTFGDNMIRDVNAGLTGLEINPSIPIRRGLGQPLVSNIVRSQLGVRGRIIEDESKLQQVDMLEGPEGELPHAQAVVGNVDDEELVESQKLAGNNMYSEDQQLFLGRERANKIMERRKEPLDKELNNESERGRRGDPHYEGKYDMPDIEPDQEGVDYGEVEPVEGRENMNRINQQYLENKNIRGKGSWTGNRGIGYDFQRQAMVDRESNHLRNAQSLNYLRGQSIPYNMPTRNYATNQVGLIRNSNRSMILEVNSLEP